MKKDSEVLDIIDESDKVISQSQREEAHLKDLLHRQILVFVLNNKNELFIQQRSGTKDVYPKYFEGSLSGHVSSKENYLQAAIRELKEELSIDVTKPMPGSILSREYPPYPVKLFSFRIHTAEENVIAACFVLKDYSGVINIDKSEVLSGKFMKLTEIKEEIRAGKKQFTPLFLEAFNKFSKEISL
jgi:isopentenyldiphosphate isomerase